VISDADISDCGLYRFRLSRNWSDELDMLSGQAGKVTWVMCNPSTADQEADDPTIRRILGFSKRWGYSELMVVNLCPFRTSSPSLAVRHPLPTWARDKNMGVLVLETMKADLVVAAWGRWGGRLFSADHALRTVLLTGRTVLLTGRPRILHALAETRGGDPAHPLARGRHRVPDDAKPYPWPFDYQSEYRASRG
jgi:hypothetical protein